MRVGRRRQKNLKLPAGVRERGGAWYWKPTSGRDREARRARGEKVEVYIGQAGTIESRKRWAELTGRARRGIEGTVEELCDLWQSKGMKLQANGEPRADSTVVMYGRALEAVRARFGACRYGKTVDEAARESAIGTAMIQRWADDHPHKGMLKREFAVLDNVFTFAIRQGKTTYNPCADVALGAGGVREREPLSWEVECLRALASPRLGLQMDFEGIVGWRIGDVLDLVRAQGTADGVRVRYRKRGKRHLWEWTPELRRIWREAENLPGATRFPASPVFPSVRRGHLSYGAFDSEWQALKRRVNAELAAGTVDPGTLERAAGLAILDFHFHDLRSKAHDDAEDLGHLGHEFLGNTRGVARRHYRRREQRRRPLK